MKNNKNGDFMQLNDYFIKSDLAFELVNTKNRVSKMFGKIDVIDIDIDKNEGKIINKNAGRYIAINFNSDVMDEKRVEKVFYMKLLDIMRYVRIGRNDYGLIIGLGNSKSSPDSLGTFVIDGVLATNHLFEMGLLGKKVMRISTFKPGVYGITGLDTNRTIEGIINEVKPSFLIVIDSLVTKTYTRLNNTIQITDAGIEPGRYGCKISKEIYGIPVISIGIPTVLEIRDSKLLVTSNDIDFILKKEGNIIINGINKIIKNKYNI